MTKMLYLKVVGIASLLVVLSFLCLQIFGVLASRFLDLQSLTF